MKKRDGLDLLIASVLSACGVRPRGKKLVGRWTCRHAGRRGCVFAGVPRGKLSKK